MLTQHDGARDGVAVMDRECDLRGVLRVDVDRATHVDSSALSLAEQGSKGLADGAKDAGGMRRGRGGRGHRAELGGALDAAVAWRTKSLRVAALPWDPPCVALYSVCDA